MESRPHYKMIQYRPKAEEPAGYTLDDALYVMSQLMEKAPLTETELRDLLWNALVQIIEGIEKPTQRSAAKTFMEAYPIDPPTRPEPGAVHFYERGPYGHDK